MKQIEDTIRNVDVVWLKFLFKKIGAVDTKATHYNIYIYTPVRTLLHIKVHSCAIHQTTMFKETFAGQVHWIYFNFFYLIYNKWIKVEVILPASILNFNWIFHHWLTYLYVANALLTENLNIYPNVCTYFTLHNQVSEQVISSD